MSTDNNFKLLSLPGWTRGESIKMLFFLAEEPFIDQRVTITEWKLYKQKNALPPTTFLPILKTQKYCINGALNIGRALSRQFGFYAETTNEQSQIDEILGYVETLHASFLPILRANLMKNLELRIFQWNEYKEHILKPILQFFVTRLGQNDYFIGNRITFADIAVVEILSKYATLCEPDLLRPYPILDAHLQRIEHLPQLTEYLKQRDRTFF